MTTTEKILWFQVLRRDQLGCRFLRQVRIGNYIVDFFCFKNKLIIEVDGESHKNKIFYDHKRDLYLESIGYKVLHFDDYEISTNLESVVRIIKENLR